MRWRAFLTLSGLMLLVRSALSGLLLLVISALPALLLLVVSLVPTPAPAETHNEPGPSAGPVAPAGSEPRRRSFNDDWRFSTIARGHHCAFPTTGQSMAPLTPLSTPIRERCP